MTLQERREWLMRRITMGLLLVVAALVALQSIGCGGSRRPLTPVSGKLVFEDGSPLPAGTRVILEPMEGGIQSASGETSQDGSFTVKHATGKAGAEIGQYRVRLAAPRNDNGSFFQLVPDSYVDGQELSIEVKQGMGEITLKVKRRST